VQVRNTLAGHEVQTAARMGWRELENRDLLRAAEEADFYLIIICDKNLRHLQNLSGRKLAILELWTNHRHTLEKHWDYIRQNTETIKPGEYLQLQVP